MSVNCKYCFKCNSYQGYYVKLNYSFYKKPYGDCSTKHGMVNCKDTCPDWKPLTKKDSVAPISLKKLEKLTDGLNDLIFIIKSNFDKDEK